MLKLPPHCVVFSLLDANNSTASSSSSLDGAPLRMSCARAGTPRRAAARSRASSSLSRGPNRAGMSEALQRRLRGRPGHRSEVLVAQARPLRPSWHAALGNAAVLGIELAFQRAIPSCDECGAPARAARHAGPSCFFPPLYLRWRFDPFPLTIPSRFVVSLRWRGRSALDYQHNQHPGGG